MYSLEVTNPTTIMARRATHHQSSTLLDCDFNERIPKKINTSGIHITCAISPCVWGKVLSKPNQKRLMTGSKKTSGNDCIQGSGYTYLVCIH